jgi:hypothetical protein
VEPSWRKWVTGGVFLKGHLAPSDLALLSSSREMSGSAPLCLLRHDFSTSPQTPAMRPSSPGLKTSESVGQNKSLLNYIVSLSHRDEKNDLTQMATLRHKRSSNSPKLNSHMEV